jgi:hypothetical protein
VWCDGLNWIPLLHAELPQAAPADGEVGESSLSWWLDEATNKLMVKVKYSDGVTIKSGEVALA